jgi:hypothetical protein
VKNLSSYKKESEREVPLNSDVIKQCRCGICPVQSLSACSNPLLQKMINSRAEAYCSIGYADCKDLDNTKDCLCKQCQVYIDFNLAEGRPKDYFCFNGKAIKLKK